MALSIKSDEVDCLARELAAETGESLTEAVVTALRERLMREHARRGPRMSVRLRRLTVSIRDDRCLVPVSARFALSQIGIPASEEVPSGAGTRPFALRFVRTPNRAMNDPLPPYRYCPVRQVSVSDDDDDEPVEWQSTTVGSKDGKENPQEDWKPDLPFHAES
ncbi:MAG: type II toxin-antitoxin system VapB family antitoxin [Pseudonocardiaceae bacterium]